MVLKVAERPDSEITAGRPNSTLISFSGEARRTGKVVLISQLRSNSSVKKLHLLSVQLFLKAVKFQQIF